MIFISPNGSTYVPPSRTYDRGQESGANNMTEQTRDGRGEFTRNPETAKRDAEAASMRSRSMTYQQIADALGINKASAYAAVQRAMAEILTEPAEAARQFELDKLDALERGLLATLERKHYIVSHGKIVYKGEAALEDDGFVVTASLALLRFSESRRKLLGLDSPTKIETAGEFVYRLVGVDPDVL